MVENSDIEFLSEIGLTKGESKVYLTLLDLGQSKIGTIAKESIVSRSKLYVILNKLTKKGLVGHSIKSKTQYFTAMEPRRILNYMDEKQQELEKQRTLAEKMISTLEIKRKINNPKTEATLYEGKKAIKNFYLSLLDELKSGETYYVIGAGYGESLSDTKAFFQNYHTQRSDKNIKVKMLANIEEKNKLVPATLKNSEVRYLPQYLVTNIITVFYRNKTFIFFLSGEPKGFLLENETIVESYKKYFETFWKIAQK
jgi:sugar-specific transcriptional regulator TrmB